MKADDYKSGWQTHPGTFCGHYFPAGEIVSLCKKERRGIGGEVLADCFKKCVNCQRKIEQPQTPNLFLT